MGKRVKQKSTNEGGPERDWAPEWNDNTREQRETTVDGYTFHWGPNEVRNFLDEGVGAAHAAFKGGATIVAAEDIAFGGSEF